GVFAAEITPVEAPDADGAIRTIAHDEQPREDTTLDRLARLKPIVSADGTITAGNASSLNDGAAALLLASPDAVERYALTPIARVLGAAAHGVAPRVMGIGPVGATRKLLARLRLPLRDFEVIELNEAFAAQALAVLRAL